MLRASLIINEGISEFSQVRWKEKENTAVQLYSFWECTQSSSNGGLTMNRGGFEEEVQTK